MAAGLALAAEECCLGGWRSGPAFEKVAEKIRERLSQDYPPRLSIFTVSRSLIGQKFMRNWRGRRMKSHPRGGRESFSSKAEVFEVQQHVGGVGVDAEGSGLLEFVFAVAAGEDAYAEGAAAGGGQHVPDTVPGDDAVFDWDAQAFGGEDEDVGGRLGFRYIVAGGYDGIRWDREVLQQALGLFLVSRGCYCPAHAEPGQVAEEFLGSGEHADAAAYLCKYGIMFCFEGLDVDFAPAFSVFAEQLLKHGFSAHADAAMDFPIRQNNTCGFQGIGPCNDMLVDGVDERSVEIKQNCGFNRFMRLHWIGLDSLESWLASMSGEWFLLQQ